MRIRWVGDTELTIHSNLLWRQLIRQTLRHCEQSSVQAASNRRCCSWRDRAGTRGQGQTTAGLDDIVLRDNLSSQGAAPKLDAEKVLRLVEIRLSNGTTNDLIDTRVDEVVDWS